MRIAVFITPHGYGHAARAAAVIEAIRTRAAVVEFEIITTVPRWFFTDCLGEAFEFYHCQTDLGLIQSTPFAHDLDATLAHLDRHLPFSDKTVDALALRLDRSGTDLVISDISPLGVVVAHKAQIPSVLVENFTWDWISRVPHLLTVPRVQRTAPNGAQAVAQYIAERYLR